VRAPRVQTRCRLQGSIEGSHSRPPTGAARHLPGERGGELADLIPVPPPALRATSPASGEGKSTASPASGEGNWWISFPSPHRRCAPPPRRAGRGIGRSPASGEGNWWISLPSPHRRCAPPPRRAGRGNPQHPRRAGRGIGGSPASGEGNWRIPGGRGGELVDFTPVPPPALRATSPASGEVDCVSRGSSGGHRPGARGG